MNPKLKSILTILGIYLGSTILAIILSPLGGAIHRSFWEFKGCWFWGPCDTGAKGEGFIYFFIFILAILTFSLLKQKVSWAVFIIGTVLFWAVYILMIITEDLRFVRDEYIGSLVIMLISFAVGYAIAFGIRKLIRK